MTTTPFVAQVMYVAGFVVPRGWAVCNGALLPISQNQALFALLGPTYGGNGQTNFALPNLASRTVIGAGQGAGLLNYFLGESGGSDSVTIGATEMPTHSHTLQVRRSAGTRPIPSDGLLSPRPGGPFGAGAPNQQLGPSLGPAGGSQGHPNVQPSLVLTPCIATQGIFPSSGGSAAANNPYIGEIMLFAGNFAPAGYAFCHGQVLSIASNTALFSVLGTAFGGNGQTTFALPDLRSRAPMHAGAGPGLTPRSRGETGGQETVTLQPANMPAHTHTLLGVAGEGDGTSPGGRRFSKSGRGDFAYGPGFDPQGLGAMSATAIAGAGGGAPHSNLQPYLAMNYCIALTGIFPPRP